MVSSLSSIPKYINALPSEASGACQEESPPSVYLWRVMFHRLVPHDPLQELCSSTHLDLFALTVDFQTRSRQLERAGNARAMRAYRDDNLLETAHAHDDRPPAIHPKIYSPPHASTSQLQPPCTRHVSGTYPPKHPSHAQVTSPRPSQDGVSATGKAWLSVLPRAISGKSGEGF